MSTRSTAHFVDDAYNNFAAPKPRNIKKPEAIVYRHMDGYVAGAGRDLYRFFRAYGCRSGRPIAAYDAQALAAKYVVWLAGEYTADGAGPLDFMSVYLMRQDPGDIEYRYTINASRVDANGCPLVMVEEKHGYGDDAPWSSYSLTRDLVAKELRQMRARYFARKAQDAAELEAQRNPAPIQRADDSPEPGKQYRLTGGSGTPSIMRGDSWAASEVKA